MGCATSKLPADDSPAVSLCRERCALLDHALAHRFAFAHAHAAYLLSLKSVGLSLQRFFADQHDPAPASPTLNLPPRRKGDASPPDHHLRPPSDSDSDDHADSSLHLHHDYGNPKFNLSFMKNQTTASVVHTQVPVVPETLYTGDFFYPNNDNYSGFLNFSSEPVPPPVVEPSTSKGSSPPPPPVASNSTWEFLNPFDSVESYYLANTPGIDSKEVREAEGIPELEDEDEEVVKEIHGDQRLVGGGKTAVHSNPAAQNSIQDTKKPKTEPSAGLYKPRGSGGFKGDMEVVREIQVEFDRASDFGSELAKFLEVGKVPYKGKHSSNQVSPKLLHLSVALSLPSLSKATKTVDPSVLDVEEEAQFRLINLSSTLHKLYLWEKKLYEEVKVEERMRVLYEGKSTKLKHLDGRGAEVQKLDATRNFVRSLSTKIKIAMQVVDKISVKINNLRDEELWPQLCELIQGLSRMWKSMLECHRNQRRAIGEAKRLNSVALHKNHSDSHYEAIRQLEHDLINWTLGFSSWVGAQKDYVQTLNSWLMKCLLHVPEETPDGLAPFSPGRMGAPPVFVVCNQWSKSLDRISTKEVMDSTREFASNLLLLWDQEKSEMRQRMLASKDEKRIKILEKEDQKIQKGIQALDQRMVFISGVDNAAAVHPRETSLQASLQHVLEAMERFCATSLNVYEELLHYIEEDRIGREHEKVL